MPDLSDRAAFEETFAGKLGKRGQQVAKDILDWMGDPPRALSEAEWREVAQRYGEVIQPQLETIYQSSGGKFYDHLGVGRDEDALGRYAQTWARDHATSLMDGIVDNSTPRLDALRADFAGGRLSAADFREGVRRLFGVQRAEMIAATETTRAAVAAERQVVDGLRSYGLQFVAVWQTNNDALTCPICGPRHGKKYGDGWYDYPPSHPRCRCFINHVPTDVEGVT